MRNRNIYIVLFFALFFYIGTQAQSTTPSTPQTALSATHHQQHTKNGMHLFDIKKIIPNLSAIQLHEIDNINATYKKKMNDARSDTNQSFSTYKQALQSLDQDRKKQIEAILTTDQMKILADWKNKQMAMREERIQKHINKLSTTLKLNPDQINQLSQIENQFAQKFMAINKEFATQEERMQEIRSLKKDKMSAIIALLNPEQKEKFNSYMQSKREKSYKSMDNKPS